MKIDIKGKFALFTRPELKVERYSYSVPTPSAISGLLKSIYWKPEMEYVIDKIHVLSEIKYESVTTNAQSKQISVSDALNKNGIDRNINATPRTMRILKDVHYQVEFHIILTGKGTSADDTVMKHEAILSRRIENGQFGKQHPYLGAREFECEVTLIDKCAKSPFVGRKELGMMLHHINYSVNGNKAIFYRAYMVDGVIDCNKESDIKEGWVFEELCNFFDKNKDRLDLPDYGYSSEKITYELVLDRSGKPIEFNPLNISDKNKCLPKMMNLPTLVGNKSSNIVAHFLWDNEKYVFGMDSTFQKGFAKKKAFSDMIDTVIGPAIIPEVESIKSFYRSFELYSKDIENLTKKYCVVKKEANGTEHPQINANIVFRILGNELFVHDNPDVKRLWNSYYTKIQSGNIITDIITGKEDVCATEHPTISGVAGAGINPKLVSVFINSTAFNSYGWSGLENSVFGKQTVYKYSASLTYLLSDIQHRVTIGNSTFVFWCDNDSSDVLSFIKDMLIKQHIKKQDISFDTASRFFILELCANSTRLVVKNFDSFNFSDDDSQQRLLKFLTDIQPIYKGTKLQTNWDYAESIGEVVMENKAKAFLLGSLFAVLEKIQKDAVPSTKINSSIAEKYILNVSKNPARVFPGLLAKSQHHTNKNKYGVAQKRVIEDIMEQLNTFDDPFPIVLTAKEQCDFYLGYNAKTKEIYTKKNKDTEKDA